MSVSIKVEKGSLANTKHRLEVLGKHYPEETFKAIVKTLFDIKTIAQRKIKADKHIVTARLINSIFVKTPKQKFARRMGNNGVYSDWLGHSFNADFNVNLGKFDGAVGTNVVYAKKIEKLDSYMQHAAETVDINKRLREVPGNVKRKMK